MKRVSVRIRRSFAPSRICRKDTRLQLFCLRLSASAQESACGCVCVCIPVWRNRWCGEREKAYVCVCAYQWHSGRGSEQLAPSDLHPTKRTRLTAFRTLHAHVLMLAWKQQRVVRSIGAYAAQKRRLLSAKCLRSKSRHGTFLQQKKKKQLLYCFRP